MSDSVFSASVKLLKRLVDRGTQKEISLNGNGESFLDTSLIERVKTVRKILGDNNLLLMSTNSTLVTKEIAISLKDAGLDEIHTSIHKPEAVRKALPIFSDAGLKTVINAGVIIFSHNWAGQLEDENKVPKERLPDIQCDPLIDGRGYVSAEGNISPCCYDYRNIGVFGTVFNKDILDKEYGAYELCRGCHQVIPPELL